MKVGTCNFLIYRMVTSLGSDEDEGGVTRALVETVTSRDLAELDATLTDNRRWKK